MSYSFLDIAVTPSVLAAQTGMGSDGLWRAMKRRPSSDQFSDSEAGFIAARDSFYMASVSETGWPYLQHRGGPRGFLKLIDARTLAFLDYSGNRQYISTGNVNAEGRVCLFLMDYAHRARLKIYGHAEVVALEDDRVLAAQLADPGYKGKPERIFRLHLDAFDWNCPQHITPRFSEAEVSEAMAPMRERMARLEAENGNLRAQLDAQVKTPAAVPDAPR